MKSNIFSKYMLASIFWKEIITSGWFFSFRLKPAHFLACLVVILKFFGAWTSFIRSSNVEVESELNKKRQLGQNDWNILSLNHLECPIKLIQFNFIFWGNPSMGRSYPCWQFHKIVHPRPSVYAFFEHFNVLNPYFRFKKNDGFAKPLTVDKMK